MSMDFSAIVYNLFADPFNRHFSVNYFKREFNKSKNEGYDAETFFQSCIMVMDQLRSDMDLELIMNEVEKKEDIPFESYRFIFEIYDRNRNKYSWMITGEEYLQKMNDLNEAFKQSLIPSNPNPDVTSKPIFKSEEVPKIFEFLKHFFSEDQRSDFDLILKTGNDLSTPLIFLDNGNRLADAFKQLKDIDFITGCNKKELEAWIKRNFVYKSGKKTKSFTLRYVNDIISSKEDNKCKNPILDIKKINGKWIITN
jgi:hypothetical protein